mmetsp:Transcript_79465/g.199737  ORF Transcript_79465/g.199737 Transcript_79465/m.199737 type:complete len:213 (-) Transcript_79465:121-759(-)
MRLLERRAVWAGLAPRRRERRGVCWRPRCLRLETLDEVLGVVGEVAAAGGQSLKEDVLEDPVLLRRAGVRPRGLRPRARGEGQPVRGLRAHLGLEPGLAAAPALRRPEPAEVAVHGRVVQGHGVEVAAVDAVLLRGLVRLRPPMLLHLHRRWPPARGLQALGVLGRAPPRALPGLGEGLPGGRGEERGRDDLPRQTLVPYSERPRTHRRRHA